MKLFVSALAIILAAALILGIVNPDEPLTVQPPSHSGQPKSAEQPTAPLASDNEKQSIPNFSKIQNVDAKKRAFFNYLLPLIRNANANVSQQRMTLMKLVASYDENQQLTDDDKLAFNRLATNYNVSLSSQNIRQQLHELEKRIDVVPASLILAQGANESGWGSSRFAKDGNNFFGIWCYSRGCGLTPKRREAGQVHEVAYYDSVQDGVVAYLKNINTHDAYSELRQIRYQLRESGKPLSGTALAEGLIHYSERGAAYVEEIQQMISFNQLEGFTLGNI